MTQDTENAGRADRAAEAAACYSSLVRTEEESIIRDLISDLGHLADRMGINFLEEARAGIAIWADEKLYPDDDLGPMGSEHRVTIEVQGGK